MGWVYFLDTSFRSVAETQDIFVVKLQVFYFVEADLEVALFLDSYEGREWTESERKGPKTVSLQISIHDYIIYSI